jgi:ribosome-binding protein aMBF1 (putative translation factor)
MPMKCEICGSVEVQGEAPDSALLSEQEHLHICASCVKDRQYEGDLFSDERAWRESE